MTISSRNNNGTPMPDEDKQGVSVNIRLPQKSIQKWIGLTFCCCLSFGLGSMTASSQSQAQTQRQSQSPVTNCNLEQATTTAPTMPSRPLRKD
jgi:hypothetical protein